MEKWQYFITLAKEFKKQGYHLYMVGGSTRDFLINKESDDLDLTTDATPEEMLLFLKSAQTTFMRFGTLRLTSDFGHVDITTFREEKEYKDYRHPSKVSFVRDLTKDAKRRDFTINAIYMDDKQEIIDPFHGRDDLKRKIIRTIGNPVLRFQEDPLRILRAVRFAMLLDFEIEEETKKAMAKEKTLLAQISPQKVMEEIKKMKKIDEQKYIVYLEKYNVLDSLSFIYKKDERN